MHLKLINIAFWILLSILPGTADIQGQILKDSSSVEVLGKGVAGIYNFQFDIARSSLEKLKQKFPEHPVIYLLKGMITYWENYPLVPASSVHNSFENDMYSCISLCEEKSDTADYEEFLLANLGARGMLLTYYADNNFSENVFPLATSTYRYIRQLFDYTSNYADFLFFTGLYNYYREAYPEAHPVYRLFAFLFPKGDKEKGIREILTSAEYAIMLRAESYFFLAHIYLSYENNYQQAYFYSKSLHDLYPSNLYYLSYYLRNLLLIKEYNDAEKLVRQYETKARNSFLRAQLSVFNGIIQEKKYKNYGLAMKYYNEGLKMLSPFGYYGNEYSSYACFGLSRISDINNDRSGRRSYRKQALELTSYKDVNFDD